MMTEKTFAVAFQEYSSIDELSIVDRNLCLESKNALQSSYSPYSEFQVGAAIILESGRIILGSNQENVAFPSGLCAERVALFTKGAQYPDDPIVSIAITARSEKFTIEHPISPCGGCLQVLGDFEQRQKSLIKVLLYCLDGSVLTITGASNFLPFQFIEQRLKI